MIFLIYLENAVYYIDTCTCSWKRSNSGVLLFLYYTSGFREGHFCEYVLQSKEMKYFEGYICEVPLCRGLYVN